ncbi:MAG: asparagine synthase (glutamine-hydrolyzing) [Candidatus Omnitrophota bacterium]|jgi:asparagine synthase (glutamine-hydrolysing)
MCGILGGTRNTWDFEGALNALRHRGPDSQKIKKFKNFTLAFARLAIIDLRPLADQPMSSEDDQIHIVFNGEIYGFKRLREELILKGYRFLTHSDTEVLLKAYLCWGDNFVEHVDGMFAIALLDQRSQKIKLFRDRPGIKPLYYLFNGTDFAFASELKGIKTLCQDHYFKYDNTALYDYLTYKYIPDPKSLYKDVYKLPPAHQLTYDILKHAIIKNAPFWRLNIPPTLEPIPIQAASNNLRKLIKESVADQMVADVPVGFFLSGGMDSSVVVAESSLVSSNLNTFTIGFDDPDYTETTHAQIVADHFKTNHFSRILTYSDNDTLLNKLREWYDEPFADTSAMPTYLVSAFAREKVTVALTGDGGDEILGGYNSYFRYRAITRLVKFGLLNHSSFMRFFANLKKYFIVKSFPYKFFNFLSHLCPDDLLRYSKVLGMMDPCEKKIYAQKLTIPKDYDDLWFLRQYDNLSLPALTRLQFIDFHTYLPCDVLTKTDRVSMAVSLEARVPLLSKNIIEFAFSVPEKTRYYNNSLKGLLKAAYSNILPKDILTRPKKGFSVPLNYLGFNYKMPHEKILKKVFDIDILSNQFRERLLG